MKISKPIILTGSILGHYLLVIPLYLWILTTVSDIFDDTDYQKYEGTPAWELAKAVKSNDTAKIRHLVVKEGVDINYQHRKSGYTILMTALQPSYCVISPNPHFQVKAKTIQTLLELGADPNIFADKDYQDGLNPVLIASKEHNTEGLKLLLEYGGNPNAIQRKTKSLQSGNDTALMLAANSFEKKNDIETMQILLDAGADINKTTMLNRYGVLYSCKNDCRKALFLLEHGANPDIHFSNLPLDVINDMKNVDDSTTTYIEYLRNLEPDDDEEYQYKLKIVGLLKDKGYALPDDIMGADGNR